MWNIDFRCPHCTTHQSLRSKGIYNRVRFVLDIKDYYYLVGEYMYCSVCNGTFLAWDHRMLEQLTDGVKATFPVVLTRKYACDVAVVSLLRARTLGNSPSALRNNLHELHSEEHLRRQLRYSSCCERHHKGLQSFQQTVPHYQKTLEFPFFPTAQWFLAVYVWDVWSILPALLVAATSAYGSILKIDSTKKICKKFQGAAADTANWSTNVGNERGEIVQSVVTSSEDLPSLQRLANGIMERYQKAGEQHPVLLYTDRDCCSQHGPSRFNNLFHSWESLQVRLDIWHFMRRLAQGCTTESHPLYGVFMSRLSMCIFEWDKEDFQLLITAKKEEMKKTGIYDPSDSAVKKAINTSCPNTAEERQEGWRRQLS